MKKAFTGEDAAELLFHWRRRHSDMLEKGVCRHLSQAEVDRWIPVAMDLAMHLAIDPESDLTAWPWQARHLLDLQIVGWMQVAVTHGKSKSLPVDIGRSRTREGRLRWLFETQIAPMSVLQPWLQ